MLTRELSVLLVGSQCPDIERLLRHTCWRVWLADGAAQARDMLKRVPVQVVLCQHGLRDGTWLKVLTAAERCAPPASVIVLLKPDDRAWADVLKRGAYDWLPLPCSAPELYTIVPMAWRHCMHQHLRGTRNVE